MKNSRRISVGLITLTLMVLISSTAAADFSLKDWRFIKEIVLPPGIQPGSLVEISPDKELYAGAAPGLADVRIISGGNAEIPYKLEISQAGSERTSFPVSLLDRGYIPGSYDIFTADLGRTGVLHNEIAFTSPVNDFRSKATVETSNDGAAWMLVAEQTVYAFTVPERGFTTRNTAVRYPESSARYLRVKITDTGEGTLDIAGATVFYIKETAAREILWAASILGTARDAEQRSTIVDIDLGAPGLPGYRIALNIPDANFFREVALKASSGRSNWRTVLSQAEIFAFDTPKFTGKNLVITYPETISRYLRLTIFDEDSPPLTVAGVSVWGLHRRLVFTADPEQSYRLYYGNPKARRPSYDIERIFPYLATERLPEAGLSPLAINAGFIEEKPPEPPLSERLPWLFPTVIAAAAVIVALLLLVVFRQVRKSLPPPQ